jgi:hypothetical protein
VMSYRLSSNGKWEMGCSASQCLVKPGSSPSARTSGQLIFG